MGPGQAGVHGELVRQQFVGHLPEVELVTTQHQHMEVLSAQGATLRLESVVHIVELVSRIIF